MQPVAPSRDHIEIHEYWKGRLAPLPGYRSQPVLLPMNDPEVKEEAKSEEKDKKSEKRLKLLPPVSFYGKNYVELQSSLKQTPSLKNETKVSRSLPPSNDDLI